MFKHARYAYYTAGCGFLTLHLNPDSSTVETYLCVKSLESHE